MGAAQRRTTRAQRTQRESAESGFECGRLSVLFFVFFVPLWLGGFDFPTFPHEAHGVGLIK